MAYFYQEAVRFIRTLYNKPEGIIPLHAPVFKGNEKKYLEDCIESTFVSSVGKYVDELELKIAEFTGAAKAVACVNGTAALHLALKLVGVDYNTEVVTQPLTFIATANAITYCGARPVFIDIDKNTLGLSPTALRNWLEKNTFSRKSENSRISINKKTGKRIAACIPMHTFGFPCEIDSIVDICNEYNISVVEDAAESLGSFYKNKHTGTFSKIGVLSFNGNKIITTGGGGMMLIQNEELATRAKHLTTQAKVPHPWEFIHDEVGYNYRMPNINAAIGLAQLEQLPTILKQKHFLSDKYRNFFKAIPQIKYFTHQKHLSKNVYQPNYWLNCILLPSVEEKDAFLKYTNENKVMTRPSWNLLNELEVYKNCETDSLSNARTITVRLVNIPSSISI